MNDGCLFESSFQADKCCLVVQCPVEFCIMTCKSWKQFCDLSKCLDEILAVAYKAKESHTCLALFSGCMILIASVFDGRSFIPVALRIWPKY